MSRYNIPLTPQQPIPRDLKLGIQMQRAITETAIVTETNTVVEPPPKQLLITGPAQVGGLNAHAGSPTTFELYIMTTAALDADLDVVVTSSDETILAPAAGNGSTHTLLAGLPLGTNYARYDLSCIIYQGGSVDVTVSAPGWESDVMAVWANALALGQDNFAEAEAIIAVDTAQIFQGYLYPIPNSLFTREVDEPLHAGANGERSIWWKITPDVSGTLSVDTLACDSGLDTVLAIYTGSSVDALAEIASNDDASGSDRRSELLGVPVSGGTTYYICAAMYNLGAGAGEIRLHYQLDVPSV